MANRFGWRWLLLSVSAVGCSPSPIPVASLTSQIITAKCQKYAHCGVIGASEVTQCIADGQRLLLYVPSLSLPAEVAAGRLAYDAAAAQACVAANLTTACSDDLDPTSPTACPSAITPKVATGGMCLDSIECVTGQCVGGGGGCMGTCAAFTALGAACTLDPQCGPNGYCDAKSMACVARAPIGGPCNATVLCVVGDVCEGGDASGASGACHAVGKVGDPCQGQYIVANDCSPGLFCDSGAMPKVCRAVLAAGATCTDAIQCLPGLSCAKPVGSATGICTAWLDLDATCNPNILPLCSADAFCDSIGMTCIPYGVGMPGNPCTTRYNCSVGLFEPFALFYCDTTNHCASVRKIGDACDVNAVVVDNPCFESTCDPVAMICTLGCGAADVGPDGGAPSDAGTSP